MSFQFTNNWFKSTAESNWKQLIPQIKPKHVLEIGSYEGAATCFLVEQNDWTTDLEILCVDTWAGGEEHKGRNIDMTEVEKRFDYNVNLAIQNSNRTATITKRKGPSDLELPKLVAEGLTETFDLIYIDGSHQSPDVLFDALLSFKLCKYSGFIFFDDYLWTLQSTNGIDPIKSPKLAIDCFSNVFCRHVRIIPAPLNQLYMQKIK